MCIRDSGQKAWHRRLCQEIRNSESASCELQPMTGDELATARSLLAELLGGVALALPGTVTLTAISPPVSRGVAPAVARMVPAGFGANVLQRPAITAAIARIAGLTSDETMVATGDSRDHVAVSYTHLDVYKRQFMRAPTTVRTCCNRNVSPTNSQSCSKRPEVSMRERADCVGPALIQICIAERVNATPLTNAQNKMCIKDRRSTTLAAAISRRRQGPVLV